MPKLKQKSVRIYLKLLEITLRQIETFQNSSVKKARAFFKDSFQAFTKFPKQRKSPQKQAFNYIKSHEKNWFRRLDVSYLAT